MVLEDVWNFFGPPNPGEKTIYDVIQTINEERKDIFVCLVAVPHQKENEPVWYQLTFSGCAFEDKETFVKNNIVITTKEESDAYYEQYVKKEK